MASHNLNENYAHAAGGKFLQAVRRKNPRE